MTTYTTDGQNVFKQDEKSFTLFCIATSKENAAQIAATMQTFDKHFKTVENDN